MNSKFCQQTAPNPSNKANWVSFCQNSSMCRRKLTDSTVSKNNLENLAGAAPHRELVPRRKSENSNLSLTSLKGQLK